MRNQVSVKHKRDGRGGAAGEEASNQLQPYADASFPSRQLVAESPSSAPSSARSLVLYEPQAQAQESHSQDELSLPLGEGATIRRADLHVSYKVLPEVIGSGSFGTVRSCIHRDTRKRRAVKSIVVRGHAGNAALLKNEIAILTQLRHRNLIKMVDVVHDGSYVHIVMEQCRGGDLFDLTHDVELGEDRIRRIVACLVDAVAYLHSKNIVHRDLKADHLMFSKDDLDSDIKIIDFGVATIHEPDSPPMTAFAGSLRTVAPEIIKRSYNRACDLWSVGVITYFMLMQQMPFDGRDQSEIFNKIASGAYCYPEWADEELSAEAKHFINCLIQVDASRRMPAAVAMNHPWVRGQRPAEGRPEETALKEKEALRKEKEARQKEKEARRKEMAARRKEMAARRKETATTICARRPPRRRPVLPGSENGRYFSDDP